METFDCWLHGGVISQCCDFVQRTMENGQILDASGNRILAKYDVIVISHNESFF